MLGFISGLGLKTKLVGDSSLSKRPMSRIVLPLEQMGVEIDCKKGTLPIFTINSDICDNFKYKMPIASAQVKSCLLLAALASKKKYKYFWTKDYKRSHWKDDWVFWRQYKIWKQK